MKTKSIKIITLIVGLVLLVFIGTSAITGIINNNKVNSADEMIKEDETVNLGEPTGDDPWKEIEKIVSAQNDKDKQIDFYGTIKVIDDNGDHEKVLEEHNFNYSIFRDNYYYKIASMEVVSKSDLILAVDHTNKLIAVAPQQPSGKKTSFFDIAEFKKLLEEQKANAVVTQLGDEKIITIDSIQNPSVQGYRIYYNPATYTINKLLVGMLRLSPLENDEISSISEPASDEIPEEKAEKNEKENSDEAGEIEIEAFTYYVEIIYSRTERRPMTIKEFNPEEKFIRRNGKQIELTEAYANYELTGTTGQ
jgi:hypothetical protein